MLTKLDIKPSTVFAWRDGTKEPKGWQRDAAEFWIDAKAGEKESGGASGRKSKGEEAEE